MVGSHPQPEAASARPERTPRAGAGLGVGKLANDALAAEADGLAVLGEPAAAGANTALRHRGVGSGGIGHYRIRQRAAASMPLRAALAAAGAGEAEAVFDFDLVAVQRPDQRAADGNGGRDVGEAPLLLHDAKQRRAHLGRGARAAQGPGASCAGAHRRTARARIDCAVIAALCRLLNPIPETKPSSLCFCIRPPGCRGTMRMRPAATCHRAICAYRTASPNAGYRSRSGGMLVQSERKNTCQN